MPVYHFACYAYQPDVIPLAPSPLGEFAGFADCATPPALYQTVCLGAMGLFQDGTVCCPPGDTPRACCIAHDCQLLTEIECVDAGGDWHPGWNSCTPDPCSLGACCTGAECAILTGLECQALGGTWTQGYVTCLPNPCIEMLRVCPDGSEPYSTIQAAVDAAVPGQGILLCDGVYQGPGNRDVLIDGISLGIQSESGNPEACRIVCDGTPEEPHRGFDIRLPAGTPLVLAGLTIEGGFVPGVGGAVLCQGGLPAIANCRIHGNQANEGGGIAFVWAMDKVNDLPVGTLDDLTAPPATGYRDQPAVSNTVISGNRAIEDGGGLLLENAPESIITECTLSGNIAGARGGGIRARLVSALLSVWSSILWDDCAGEGDETYVLGTNAGIRFTNCVIAPEDVAGPGYVSWSTQNVNLDPWFCDPEPCDTAPTPLGDYRVSASSPCVTHPDVYTMGLRGALGVGCDARTAVQDEAPPSGGLWLAPTALGAEGSPTRIRYEIPPDLAGQPATLRIFDSSGRLVWVRHDLDRSAGVHEILWDGTDLRGQPTDQGVHFCRLDAGPKRVTSRLVRVK